MSMEADLGCFESWVYVEGHRGISEDSRGWGVLRGRVGRFCRPRGLNEGKRVRESDREAAQAMMPQERREKLLGLHAYRAFMYLASVDQERYRWLLESEPRSVYLNGVSAGRRWLLEELGKGLPSQAAQVLAAADWLCAERPAWKFRRKEVLPLVRQQVKGGLEHADSRELADWMAMQVDRYREVHPDVSWEQVMEATQRVQVEVQRLGMESKRQREGA